MSLQLTGLHGSNLAQVGSNIFSYYCYETKNYAFPNKCRRLKLGVSPLGQRFWQGESCS
ncbi:hypothetical protein PCASD_10460 [Puccinia coronata f. sp. avenae]|uniref:Uncharacterized protein n=1 Tax=Puccinia coronata f. sp. avenae TaxID=200324 RepID=A0A2N5UEL9_9BASI|nr:hypothetical protein PCASD_10460 [Puccinia coronata f. sp. avenae]